MGGGRGGRHSGAGIRWKEAVKSLLEQLLKTPEDSLLHLEAISDSARELEKSAGCWGRDMQQAASLLPSVVRMRLSRTLDCDRRWLTQATLSTALTMPT